MECGEMQAVVRLFAQTQQEHDTLSCGGRVARLDSRKGSGARLDNAVFRSGPMPILVMKFGGTSVADLERIRNAALKVKREVEAGWQVAVIVSAMAGETNRLVGLVRGISPLYDAREYDAVVAAGEQVTAG